MKLKVKRYQFNDVTLNQPSLSEYEYFDRLFKVLNIKYKYEIVE